MKKNKRMRVSPEERDLIEKHRGENIYNKDNKITLSAQEQDVIETYRRVQQESRSMGVDPKNVMGGWLKSKEVSLRFKNPDFADSNVDYKEVRDKFIKDAKSHAPEYKTLIRSKRKDEYLLVMNPADLHIGKLSSSKGTGEKYNVDVAIKTARQAITALLDRASGYDVSKILFVVGNDILHVDNSIGTTTRGTKQDTDQTWHENFVAARKLYVEIIEMLIPVADVHIMFAPSNHDYVSGFFLADAVSCWFSKSDNVTFDVDMRHRKYYSYGNNLIGISHGDKVKMEQLPLLMANEAKEQWAKTDYRYYYLGHIHHKEVNKFRSGKDYQGCTVEYLRSPSGTDQWHHESGYQHVKKAIEAFIHHKEHGQVGRLTYHV